MQSGSVSLQVARGGQALDNSLFLQGYGKVKLKLSWLIIYLDSISLNQSIENFLFQPRNEGLKALPELAKQLVVSK